MGLDEPLAFIFSYPRAARGLGQSQRVPDCTPAESNSEIKKRQEIGRGPAPGGEPGWRARTRSAINRLTLIANESYEDFANQLQTEMIEAGVRFKREMVHNERDKVTVRLKKGFDTDPFLALWERDTAR
ncbi:MAG: hypothetical protein U5L74_02810, partial [Ideonella sp.]|nr:hypothetical protein [Ideonella sp.]